MKITRFILSLLLSLIVVCGTLSLSASASDFNQIKSQVDQLVKEKRLAEALVFLTSHQPEFQDDSNFDYLLGVTALAAEDNNLALNALERVVMRDPNFAGAWLDLAIAYYRLGDQATATELLAHIEQNFNPPENLKIQIADVRKKLNQKNYIQGWRVSLMGLLGRAENANFGINSASFQLTPIGAPPVDVVVAGSSRPKSSNASEWRLDAYRQFKHDSGSKSEVQIFGRMRHYNQVDGQDLGDIGAYWIVTRPIDTKLETSQGVSLRHVMIDQKSIATFASILGGLRLSLGQCSLGGRLEFERRILDGDQANADVPWVGGSVSCPFQSITLDGQYRYGWDNPDGTRAGGKTIRQESSLQARWTPKETLQLRALVYYADYQDQEGYSQLLNNNAKRHIRRFGQRVELDWWLPITHNPGWSLHLEADNVENDANIEVVKFRDTQVFMGLRYQLF